MRKTIQSENGYVALITVLIIGAAGLAIAVSLLLLGLSSTRTSFALEQSREATAFADACSEEALERIRRDSSYTSSGSLTFTNGGCSYTISDLGGSNREIQSTGTVGTIVRKVEITLDQVDPINVTSWQEVGDF